MRQVPEEHCDADYKVMASNLLKKKATKDLHKQSILQLTEAFSLSIGDQPVKFLSFAQRKFVGFRNQYEYDRKRLLIATDTQFCIIGYDINEQPEELINT